jgi:uncharacterized protein (UPF0262 family)
VSEFRHRIAALELDQKSVVRWTPQVEHERSVAIFDLLEGNRFKLVDGAEGPYSVILSLRETSIVFAVSPADRGEPVDVVLTTRAFRRVIKDYFMVCESYYEAIRTAPPSRIEALDMGRRALHDEGGQILAQRLKGKIATDRETARRLFTLICALHWKGERA